MCQAMLISLGGSPEPIARALAEHKPRFVCFLASHQSVDLIGKVRELLEAKGGSLPEKKIVLVDDINDLVHCYEKALVCARYLEPYYENPDQVVVDYTGGTKTMTAALTLATVHKGYRFSYVGGEVRNKGGLGVVETGHEVVHTGISPWEIFAVQEWNHLVLYVNHYQYEAALTLVRELKSRSNPGDQLLWQGLEQALQGLHAWDCFSHREALPLLRRGVDALEKVSALKPHPGVNEFIPQAKECLDFLISLSADTREFKTVSRLLAQDLLANAQRRAQQGRYDDAMARLYRTLEMLAQLSLKELGISTSNVPENQIPDPLKEEFLCRYRDPHDHKIKIPLEAAFRLLQALNHPEGIRFFQKSEDFRKILYARNNSILAHGLQPVTPETYEALIKLVSETFALQPKVTFPKLRFPF